MPFVPEAELKRPDLKGEFICANCEKVFCHSASLNRHRLNFHGDGQDCLICDEKIPENETVRAHMKLHHGFQSVYTCGCCNWTFQDKKALHAHNACMKKTGGPGATQAIAIGSAPAGSLTQHEIRGEERTSTAQPLKKKTSSPNVEVPPTMLNQVPSSTDLALQITEMLANTQVPNMMTPQNQVNLVSLFMSNPAFLSLFQQQQQLATATANVVKQEELPLSSFSSGRASPSLSGEVLIDIKAESNDYVVNESFAGNLLVVQTDSSASSTSSGPESGIGSSYELTPSPSSIPMRSKEGTPSGDEQGPSASPLDVVKSLDSKGNRKRKTIHDIASILYKKKMME